MDNFTKEAEIILDMIAEKFGTTVDLLWGVLIRQVYVDATVHFIYLMCIIVGLFLLIRMVKWLVKDYYEKSPSSDFESFLIDSGPVGTLSVVASLVFFILSLVSLPFLIESIIGRFVNPEYYALKLLMEFFKF